MFQLLWQWALSFLYGSSKNPQKIQKPQKFFHILSRFFNMQETVPIRWRRKYQSALRNAEYCALTDPRLRAQWLKNHFDIPVTYLVALKVCTWNQWRNLRWCTEHRVPLRTRGRPRILSKSQESELVESALKASKNNTAWSGRIFRHNVCNVSF